MPKSHPKRRLFALLRAINVGGHTVTMEKLRECFGALGFAGVETFIASGNVIFETPVTDLSIVQQRIENRLQQSLGYEVKTFIRTEAEIAALAQYQPFPASRMQTAGALNLAFLSQPLKSEAQKRLMTLKTEIDDFHIHGCEVYWLCKKKQSESKFSNVRFEKTLGVHATFRGMNTVLRLAAKYGLSSSAIQLDVQAALAPVAKIISYPPTRLVRRLIWQSARGRASN